MTKMSKQYLREEDKTDFMRLLELLQALQIIRDCLNAVESEKLYMILPIGGQVRSLLADKSTQNKPLLYDLARKANVEPDLYFRDPVKLSNENDLVVHLPGIKPTLSRVNANQKMVSISEFLDARAATIRKRHYTVRDVIEFAANKSGGAHYAKKVAPQVWEDMSISSPVTGKPFWQWALIDIGKVTLQLGVSLLRQTANFSVHLGFILRVSVQSGRSKFMVSSHNATPMKWTLVLGSDETLAFSVVGLCGTECVAMSNRSIDWSKPRHICGTVNLQEDLSTAVSLFIDSELVSQTYCAAPLFIYCKALGYALKVNESRGAHGDHKKCGFGMYELRIYSNYLQDEEKHLSLADHYQELANDRDRRCIYLGPNASGFSSAGELDCSFDGHEWSTIGQVLAKPFEGKRTAKCELGKSQ